MEELMLTHSRLLRNERIVWDEVRGVVLGNSQLDADGRLLQLSLCRCLFSEREGRSDQQVLCPVSEMPTVVRFMIHFICDEEQLVSFCAKNALLSLLKSSQIESEWVAQMSSLITPSSLSTHRAVYCLQAITELLKMSRKDPHFSERTQGAPKHSMFHGLHLEWTRMLHLCTHKADTCTSPPKWKELFNLEFISHSEEILRHKCCSSASGPQSGDVGTQCPIAAAQQVVVRHLSLLISTVTQGTCSSLQFLVTQLSKVFSVFLKIANGNLFISNRDCLEEALGTIFRMVELKATANFWIRQHCPGLLRACKQGEGGTQQTRCPDMKMAEYGQCISTLIRKVLLCLLKYAVAVTSNEDCAGSCSLERILPEGSQDVCSTLISDRCMIGLARGAALELFVDQDDCLVDALLAACDLPVSRLKCARCSVLMRCFLTVFNVYALTARFLSSIHYDHSVLLDFLMSEETSFRDFIVKFLHMATDHWDELKSACQELDSTDIITYQETGDADALCAFANPASSILGKRKVGEYIAEASDLPKIKLLSSRIEHDDYQPSSDAEAETAAAAVHVLHSDTSQCSCETCLDNLVDCFTKLRFLLSRTAHCLPSLPTTLTTEVIKLLRIVEDLHEKKT